MLDVSAIPEAWTRALVELRKAAPYAVLAGGSLRDLALGGEPKDLDIFVPYADTPDLAAVKLQMASAHDWSPQGTFMTHGYQRGMADEVVAVQTYVVPNVGLPVQVVYLNLPAPHFRSAVLNRMDFDACRIAYDGSTLKINHEAVYALLNRRFTLLRADNADQARRSIQRARRFADRYADVTIDLEAARDVLGVNFVPFVVETFERD